MSELCADCQSKDKQIDRLNRELAAKEGEINQLRELVREQAEANHIVALHNYQVSWLKCDVPSCKKGREAPEGPHE